jgi:peptidoglycan/LPS O-acetylase OafA/YrhL
MTTNRISEIDALRGIACLMVVYNHFGNYPEIGSIASCIGCIGVDLFFIISGFVISLTIQNNSNWKYFLINRFSRLFPVYWICLILSVLTYVIFYTYINEPAPTDYLFKTFLVNLSMVQFYTGFPNIDGSYWTLIIELLFYAFILIFLIVNKKQFIEIVGAICLLFPLCLILLYDQIISDETIHHLVNRLPLLAYFPLFFSGILLYKIKFETKNTLRWILLFCCFSLQLFLFDKFYSNSPQLTFLQYSITLSVMYIAFILYVYNKLSFIVCKPTVWLGSISYCLYLIHQSIGSQVILPFLHNYLLINFWIAFILTIGAIFLISHLILTYIEKPSIAFIRSKFSFKSKPLAN